MRAALFLMPVLPLMAACGPIPLADAERQCYSQARLADRPRGEVAIGMGSDGKVRGGLEMTVTSDYIMGRDPSQVYDRCVFNKTGGQMPSRPYYDGGPV